MLAVAEAQRLILQQTRPLPPRQTLLATSLGHVLAEDVPADLDSPNYDKSMMDGYAVRCADLTEGQGALVVVEEVLAGKLPTKLIAAGQAARIMTGAAIPAGAEAVVMVERTKMLDDGRVRIDDKPLRTGQNIFRRASEMRHGDVVLTRGTVLRPQEIGVLATVGRTSARVVPTPRVCILSTGDEVVEANQTPGPGQIRNSNGPMLLAQASRGGGNPHYLGLARDSLNSLRPLITEGLEADLLILSGGVSAGKLDLVPGVLQELGVVPHFHKVEMKPGKPVYFGTRDSEQPTLVFGLPGNPVSSFVSFELFVRPALRRLRGLSDTGAERVNAVLTEDFPYRTDRPTYHPARVEVADDGWHVRPVPWSGSPDLRGLTRANALIVFPPGEHTHRAGQRFTVLRLGDE